ncbi:hypothetical protein HPB48_022244 [Haemaphysalis longicornis]|uniref:DDE-1 domain-containing protein n=1 Tax=Haemaphysalis longicornis TaxID=44386 RepID=A0A9J6FR06_HAELO|nr:hypothetical protein HPB48_022244 [Haemaphysalis longicornis]
MDEKILKSIPVTFDQFFRAGKRRAVLMVGNASCHSVFANFDNLTRKFFPLNMTAKIQLLDEGNIRVVKPSWRSELVRR